jgi:hypothetical protein
MIETMSHKGRLHYVLFFMTALLLFAFVQISNHSDIQASTILTWSNPTQIANIESVVALTHSQDRTVHVIGVQGSFPQMLVYLALSPNALNWSAPEIIGETQSGGGIRSVDVVVTSDGQVHVVWDVAQFGQRHVQYAVRAINGSWSTPGVLSSIDSEARQVSIVANFQDKVHVNWWVSGSSPGFITRYQDGNGVWLPAQQIDNGTGFVMQQQTLVDSAGNFHFFWGDLSGSPQIGGVYHRVLANSGVWQPVTKVSDDLFAPSAWVSAFRAYEKAGELYLVWGQRQTSGGVSELYFAHTSGGVWSAAQRIEDTANLAVGFLSVEDGDWFVIAWNNGLLTLLTRNNGGMWVQETPAWASSNGITAVASPNKSMHLFLYTGNLIYRYRDPAGTWADGVDMGPAPFSSSAIILKEAVPFQYDLVWFNADGAFYSTSAFVFPNQLFLPIIVTP